MGVSACTRLYDTGLYQTEHEPQRYSTERVRCRGTENVVIRYGTPWHAYRRGMARHGTRIGAVYICALSSSPTEDYGDLESVYRISKSQGQGVTCEMYSSNTCMCLVRT